ncbi:hypothetical protein [Agromyces sp. NPDC057865]|uniref:hypothetical protein n=1 Tax=Agromyces sp. NPDC057865 TaxID=3346267 RepID=UPI00366F155B
MEALWIALIGNAVALAIVFITNAATNRRERKREDREDKRLELQREDQRKAWERADRTRISDMQRDYYFEFFIELRKASLAVHNAGHGSGPDLENLWHLPAFEALERLRIFASDEAFDAATEAYTALLTFGESVEDGHETVEESEYRDRLADFLEAVRLDLGVVTKR